MEVLFIGVGSIARRHIGNLKDLLGSDVHISVLRSGKGQELGSIGQMVDHVFLDGGSIGKYYDAIFITNPTSEHYRTLLKYREHSGHFFIEKPVFQSWDEDLGAFLGSGHPVCYVACPLRYTDVIQYLKHHVDFGKVHSIRCISSSYLPDWRPGTDYRQTYSARKELGGGVSIDLIHEWDYINYLIGMPQNVSYMAAKKSPLEISSEDIALYIAEYPDKMAELHLDYFGRKPVRRIELYGEDDTVIGDLLEQKIEFLLEGKTLSFGQSRDGYQKRELRHFLDIINGVQDSDNDLETACGVLKLAGGMI